MKHISIGLMVASLLFTGSLAFAQTNLTDGDPSNDECISLQTSLLRFGSRDASTNGEVTVLQDFLISKGMLGGQTTGYYGRLTVNAVKVYQRSVGVSPTGNVGPLTKSILEKETCADSTQSTNTTSVNTAQPQITGSYTTNLPAGCMSVSGFSSISGASCVTGVNTNINNLPAITFFETTNTSINLGQSVKVTWVASNAVNCNLIHTENNSSTADGLSIGTATSYTIYPTKSASYNLYCFGSSAGGKDVKSAEKVFKVNVNTVTDNRDSGISTPSTTAMSATIDHYSGQGTLDVEPSKRTIGVFGKATGISSLGIVVSNAGGKVYGSGPGTVPVVNGQYQKVFSNAELNLAAGTYTIIIYSNDNVLLAKKDFTIKDTIPTCQLTQTFPQPPYSYPVNILVGWTSSNAAYGVSPSGDKIGSNGSLNFTLQNAEEKLLKFKFYNTFGESQTCEILLSTIKG
ncbi:MAG: peptidoglycan-binding domain-containing protein [Candidatus Paceibacterota bacterium]